MLTLLLLQHLCFILDVLELVHNVLIPLVVHLLLLILITLIGFIPTSIAMVTHLVNALTPLAPIEHS